MAKEQDVFILAEQALQKVVDQIRDDQWDMDVPPYMSYSDQKVTLRHIVNRHVYDDLWVPETLAGKTIAEVGKKYDGDLLGTDPKASFAGAVNVATEVVKALADADMERVTHLTYGDFPVREYLKHITIYRGFRVYTIAQLIGVDSALGSALVQGLWDEVVPDMDGLRAMGVFGPAIAVPADADQQTKLLGLTGFLRQ
jgi:hypothetical protein